MNLDHILFIQAAELQFYWVNNHYFWNGDKEMCQFFKAFSFYESAHET